MNVGLLVSLSLGWLARPTAAQASQRLPQPGLTTLFNMRALPVPNPQTSTTATGTC